MQRWRYFKLSLTYRKFPQMVLCDILCKLGPYIPVNPSLYLLQKKKLQSSLLLLILLYRNHRPFKQWGSVWGNFRRDS